MSVELNQLVTVANELLKPEAFSDYCPNGLQVQGRRNVKKIVSGVTASLAMIEAAIEAQADVLFVHHGFFWKGEDQCISGMKYERIKALIKADVSLLAYHLPLDAHPVYGNNAQLAERLGISVTGGLDQSANPIGNVGCLASPQTAQEFADHVGKVLDRPPLLEVAGSHKVEKVAWCTGGAQGYLQRAAALGVDLYLTGEASEQTIHEARELGVHFIAAGHHATESYGAPAVAGLLADQLGIEHQFINIHNPV